MYAWGWLAALVGAAVLAALAYAWHRHRSAEASQPYDWRSDEGLRERLQEEIKEAIMADRDLTRDAFLAGLPRGLDRHFTAAETAAIAADVWDGLAGSGRIARFRKSSDMRKVFEVADQFALLALYSDGDIGRRRDLGFAEARGIVPDLPRARWVEIWDGCYDEKRTQALEDLDDDLRWWVAGTIAGEKDGLDGFLGMTAPQIHGEAKERWKERWAEATSRLICTVLDEGGDEAAFAERLPERFRGEAGRTWRDGVAAARNRVAAHRIRARDELSRAMLDAVEGELTLEEVLGDEAGPWLAHLRWGDEEASDPPSEREKAWILATWEELLPQVREDARAARIERSNRDIARSNRQIARATLESAEAQRERAEAEDRRAHAEGQRATAEMRRADAEMERAAAEGEQAEAIRQQTGAMREDRREAEWAASVARSAAIGLRSELGSLSRRLADARGSSKPDSYLIGNLESEIRQVESKLRANGA